MHEKQNPKSRLVVDTCWSSLCACSDDFVEVYEMTDPMRDEIGFKPMDHLTKKQNQKIN